MEALGKHHIHKYPSKFTENLSNLTQKGKIEKILNIYPKGIESIIEELPPGENTVYIMLVLKEILIKLRKNNIGSKLIFIEEKGCK